MSARRLSATIAVLAGFLSAAAVSSAIELRLLAPNTEAVVIFNVKQILASDLVKSQADLVKQVREMVEQKLPGDVKRVLDKAGLDPMRDLTSITVGHSVADDPKDVVIILEGSYDPAKLEAVVKEGNFEVKTTKIGKTTVFKILEGGSEVAHIGLISDKVAVVTLSQEAMKGAISRSSGVMVSATKVKDLLKNINDKQSFGFVMTGKALAGVGELAQKAKGQKIPGVDAKALKDLDGVSGAVTIGKDVDIMLGVVFKQAAKAKELADQGTLLLPLGKGMLAKQAEAMPQLAPLVDFVDTVKISSNGSNLTVTGSFSNANLTKIFKELGNMLK